MAQVLFPQFTRLFTASRFQWIRSVAAKAGMWGLLVALLGANIQAFKTQGEANKDILGASTGRSIQQSTQSNEALEKNFSEWQKTIQQHPDYRDGYYMLAILAYQLNRIEEAESYLSVVKKLDPNYDGISPLEALLSIE